MKKTEYLKFGVICLLMTACTSNDPTAVSEEFVTPTEQTNTTDISKLSIIELPLETRANVEVGNAFAFNLFNNILDAQKEFVNFSISPLSVFTTLSMLANGDNGEAKDEILDVLGINADKESLHRLNDYNRIMLSALPKADHTTTCLLSNSIWHRPALLLKDSFIETLGTWYNTDTFEANLATQAGCDKLNKWVASKTNNVITNFLENPMSIDAAVLNATYFKSLWSEAFDKSKTFESMFDNADGSSSKTNFMNNEILTYYSIADGAEYVEMNLGYGNFKMICILPQSESDIRSFTGKTVYERLSNSRKVAKVNISLPSFEASFKQDILDVLQNMGISKACTKGLDGIFSEGELALRIFLHASTFKIDEEGAEGTAASMAGIEISASGTDTEIESVNLTFNHPFVYLIREESTNAIVFMGAVTKF